MEYAESGASDQVIGLQARFPSVAFVNPDVAAYHDARVLMRSEADCEVLISHILRWWGEHHDGECRDVVLDGATNYYYSSRRCSDILPRLNDVVELGGCHPADR